MQTPTHDTMFGRWKVAVDNEDGTHRECLRYSAMTIIYLYRLRMHLGCKTRRDLPDKGSVDNPYPGVKFVSWEYLPYSTEEKKAYEKKRSRWRETGDDGTD